jgi:hypothetical protein
MNVSKNRQVRRATARRTADASAVISGTLGSNEGRLTFQATAGEASHSTAKGSA